MMPEELEKDKKREVAYLKNFIPNHLCVDINFLYNIQETLDSCFMIKYIKFEISRSLNGARSLTNSIFDECSIWVERDANIFLKAFNVYLFIAFGVRPGYYNSNNRFLII